MMCGININNDTIINLIFYLFILIPVIQIWEAIIRTLNKVTYLKIWVESPHILNS